MVLGNSEHSVSSNTVDQLRQLLLPSGFVNTQLDVDDDEGASSLWDVDNGFHSTCTVKKKPETTWNSFKNQLRFLNPWNKSSADFDDIQPTDQRITHALKRIRGSYLTTWWGVHLIISLRQATIIPHLNLVDTRCQIAWLDGQDDVYSNEIAFNDVCSTENFHTLTLVPSCTRTQEQLDSSMKRFDQLADKISALISLCIVSMLCAAYLLRNRGRFLSKHPGGILRSMCKGLKRGTFMVSYSWTGETLSAARSIP
eukprot:gene5907-9092_t